MSDPMLSGHFPSMLPNTSLSAPPLRRPHAVTLPFHTGSFSTPFPCFSPELLAFSQHWEHLPTPPIDLHEFFLAAGGCTPPERGGSLAFAPASSFDPPQSMCFSQSFPHHRSLLRPLSVAILRPAPLSFPLISSPIPLCALFSLSSPLHQSSQCCPSLSRSPKYGSECDSLCVSRCTSPSVPVARHPLPFPPAPSLMALPRMRPFLKRTPPQAGFSPACCPTHLFLPHHCANPTLSPCPSTPAPSPLPFPAFPPNFQLFPSTGNPSPLLPSISMSSFWPPEAAHLRREAVR
jgi:hypothetical protein